MTDAEPLDSCDVLRRDVLSLVGLCATIEGYLLGDSERYRDLNRHLSSRFLRDGLSARKLDEQEVRAALSELTYRLRRSLGEN